MQLHSSIYQNLHYIKVCKSPGCIFCTDLMLLTQSQSAAVSKPCMLACTKQQCQCGYIQKTKCLKPSSGVTKLYISTKLTLRSNDILCRVYISQDIDQNVFFLNINYCIKIVSTNKQ